MAKGARSATVKRKNANLRAKIFGPAVDERTARLSARLQELASKPKPDAERMMDVDETESVHNDPNGPLTKADNDMDVDMDGVTTKHKSSTPRKSSRVEKKTNRKKPKNRMTFPTSAAKQKRIAQSKKKSA